MAYQPRVQLEPPTDWSAFEDLCWGLWKALWGDHNAQKNGRKGQTQCGVDIFGQPNSGQKWAGVQCKGKENFTKQNVSKQEIQREIRKALKFKPKLNEFTIATTSPRDQSLQEFARVETERLRRSKRFRVAVCGWNDIEDLLFELDPPIAAQFYPRIFGGQLAGLLGTILSCVAGTSQPAQSAPASFEPKNETMTGSNAPITARNETTLVDTSSVEVDANTRTVNMQTVQQALPYLLAIHQDMARVAERYGTSASQEALISAAKRAQTTSTRRKDDEGV